MSKSKDIETEINDFLQVWDGERLNDFLRDVIPLQDLWPSNENEDWVKDAVGEENERTVRLIRTVYLVSRIAEFHAGRLSRIKSEFKDLWKRLEKFGVIEAA